MPNWFAIYNTSDGSLVSQESDDSAGRVSNAGLAAQGMARVAVAGPFDPARWNPGTRTVGSAVLSTDETLRATLAGVSTGTGFATQLQRDQALILILKKLGSF